MPYLAMHTIGLLVAERGDDRVQGFYDRADAVFDSALNTDGFLARRMKTGELVPGPGSEGLVRPDRHEGPYVWPRFFDIEQPIATTLSLWTNLESVAAFSYRNRHQEALGKRYEWFEKTEYPVYVAWWLDSPELPPWSEASERLERLHDNGPGALAFDIKTPFDADGLPKKLDRPTLDRHASTVR